MAKSANNLSNKLSSHLANIEKTRKKSEELLKVGILANRDVDVIYSGLYIEAVVSFERFIEDLFIDLLSQRVKHSSKKVKPKIFFKSATLARNVLLGERSYIDWLPYEKFTKKRAKRFFENGLPFTGFDIGHDTSMQPSIDKRIEKSTDKISIIRNVLAHKSSQSFKRFQKEIISSTGGLHSKEKKPIGYLRGIHSHHPVPTTRYEQMINEIKFISVLLTT
ncbi:MAG: hypothetical protein HY808_09630 [Nitrospirae bacterium]|nr:hypothetical protein [Nitrospirota bacterium]